ncbi:MAG: hypothetical protein U5K69_09390 [Balneolaceae bacterium]|nr:hypothetical protein [Balneolaceae bacterium]
MGWFIVGASIFAWNIRDRNTLWDLPAPEQRMRWHLHTTNFTLGVCLYWDGLWCPFICATKVFTMPEFLEKRFSPIARSVSIDCFLVAYVLTEIAVMVLYAGGSVVSCCFLTSRYLGIEQFLDKVPLLVIVFAGIYTVLGGLRAVAYTEALQTLILVFGSLLVLVYGLDAIGGWNRLYEVVGSEMFNLWKPITPEGVTTTWAPVMTERPDGLVFRTVVVHGRACCLPHLLWDFWSLDNRPVYCTAYVGCREYYAGAPLRSIAAAFLKILPVFIFIIPGIIAFALAETGQIQALQNEMMADGELVRRCPGRFPAVGGAPHTAGRRSWYSSGWSVGRVDEFSCRCV